ncbi:MAG: OB-fold nucleic acid binding domain-containing protein, partial [Deferrisomatales bacterium]
AAAAQKDRARGQTNLFDLLAPGARGAEEARDDLPDVPRGPRLDELRAERELLSLYLTGHPLGEWAPLLQVYTDGGLGAVLERPDKSLVTVGGTVAACKSIVTKAGARMAFVTLEDQEGTLEVVVFPELFARAEGLLQADAPVIVRGTLERSDDSGKVLAEDVVPLAQAAERLTRSVHIHVNAALHTRRDLEALRQVLSAQEHRGELPGFLHVVVPEKAEAVIRLSPAYTLKASAGLKQAVREVFGTEGSVSYK